jgi:hypothetical protein
LKVERLPAACRKPPLGAGQGKLARRLPGTRFDGGSLSVGALAFGARLLRAQSAQLRSHVGAGRQATALFRHVQSNESEKRTPPAGGVSGCTEIY